MAYSVFIIFSNTVTSFVAQVRVSASDLEKERGAVMEEYRGSRNANGRMQEAHWLLMMEGSKVKPSLYLDLSLHGLRSLVPETLFLFYGGHNLLVW